MEDRYAELEEALENLTAGELQDLARAVANLAVGAREEGRGREITKDQQAGPRDALVQRLAAVQLRKHLTSKAAGGDGMSLRDVASAYAVTYERVRVLAKGLLGEDYDRIMRQKRG